MGKRGLSFVSDCSLLYSCNQAMQMCLIFQSRTGISLLVCAKRSWRHPCPKLEQSIPCQMIYLCLSIPTFQQILDTRHSTWVSPRQNLMRERVIIVSLSLCEPAQNAFWLDDCSRNFLYVFCKYLCVPCIVRKKSPLCYNNLYSKLHCCQQASHLCKNLEATASRGIFSLFYWLEIKKQQKQK